MSHYSPHSHFEFPLEEEEEEEKADDNHHHFIHPPCVEKRSSKKNSTMNTAAAASSSSSSSSDSDSEHSSTHTSLDRGIHYVPPSRCVFTLKPRVLTMKDITSPPDLPAKRPFKNSVEGENSQINKMEEEGKAQNGYHADDNSIDNGKYNDEIAILKAILDYYSKNGVYPFANSSALHDFLKNSLQIDVYPWHLRDQIFKLREKYMKIQEKEGDDAKKMRGNESKNADDLNELNEDKKKKGLRLGEQQDLPMNHLPKESLDFGKNLNALGLTGNSKVKELDKKWKKLQVEELEFFLKRVDLIREQTKLTLNAVKSSSLH